MVPAGEADPAAAEAGLVQCRVLLGYRVELPHEDRDPPSLRGRDAVQGGPVLDT